MSSIALTVNAVTMTILQTQTRAQNKCYQRRSEKNSSTNPHALRIVRSTRLGEQASTQDRSTLAEHTEDGKTSTSLGAGALVVSHPSEGQGNSREDTGADKEGSEVADGSGVNKSQKNVSNRANTAEQEDEGASLANFVRQHAHANTDNKGSDVGTSGETLGVDRSVSHVFQDGRKIRRERAERSVETEDDGGLHVILVVVKGSKNLAKVQLLLSVFSSALDGALADDFVLSFGEESALRRGRWEVV